MEQRELILASLHKLHTTELGVERIKRNLSLSVDDVVAWCRKIIQSPSCVVTRKGKNWYANTQQVIITINVYSNTIITAHRIKK